MLHGLFLDRCAAQRLRTPTHRQTAERRPKQSPDRCVAQRLRTAEPRQTAERRPKQSPCRRQALERAEIADPEAIRAPFC